MATKYEPEYSLTDLLNELPVSLDYSEGSNNAKLLSFYSDGMEDTLKTFQKINDWRDINNAEGAALDLAGAEWGVSRNGLDDNFYRFLIKTKQLARQTDGSCDSLIRLVAESLGASYSDINISLVEGEPNAIEFTNLPAEYIDSQRKETMVLERIRGSVVAGVRVVKIQFQKIVKTKVYYAMHTQISHVIQTTMTVPQKKEV
ncbi:DUF2612 domain-containing protein [Levilactobacillus enshiensis]|uniref:DUF2612 domain-containing protein n=1 Tax=Levilactobacillus enshiensis TaxID=2590213 RepID=UPI00117AE5FF|nr:DUF2612 domain-containing protein [Levilactobacillus enshiensis]